MSSILVKSIIKQREMIKGLIAGKVAEVAQRCADIMNDRTALEKLLEKNIQQLEYCKYIYVLNAKAIQLTSNITRTGQNASHFDRDRADRPYMPNESDNKNLHLSEAYISAYKKRPSLTAIQNILSADGELIGYLGVDYDLRELPHTENTYKELKEWRQIKGDPAIRNTLFHQQRVNSKMDEDIDEVMAVLEELMTQHGVFHGKFHFSSSRATIWLVDNPYDYRILDYENLIDPNTCLAFPRRPYFEKAIVPAEDIAKVFRIFRVLRFCDETIYLRAGSLNVVNGMVGLNFSCDGSHYIPYGEFLDKDIAFWFGGDLIGTDNIDRIKISHSIEQICLRGCNYVNSIIEQLNNDQEVGLLANFSHDELKIVLEELDSIMSVYSAHKD